MDLAERLLAGVPCTVPTPIPERELFGLLGGDFIHEGDLAVAAAV